MPGQYASTRKVLQRNAAALETMRRKREAEAAGLRVVSWHGEKGTKCTSPWLTSGGTGFGAGVTGPTKSCSFIADEPAGAATLFCNQPSVPECSWCAEHLPRVFLRQQRSSTGAVL